MNGEEQSNYLNTYNNGYDQGEYNRYNSTYEATIDTFLPIYMLLMMIFCCLGANLHEYYINKTMGRRNIRRPLVMNRKEVKDSDILKEGCVICLEKYQKKEKIVTLKCNHIFHQECIEEWCKTGKTCPLCRFSLL
tara:strand:+ start:114 stop:518 length:405 start_codon:yes stop_codon:yes gene_type:complete